MSGARRSLSNGLLEWNGTVRRWTPAGATSSRAARCRRLLHLRIGSHWRRVLLGRWSGWTTRQRTRRLVIQSRPHRWRSIYGDYGLGEWCVRTSLRRRRRVLGCCRSYGGRHTELPPHADTCCFVGEVRAHIAWLRVGLRPNGRRRRVLLGSRGSRSLGRWQRLTVAATTSRSGRRPYFHGRELSRQKRLWRGRGRRNVVLGA